MTKRTDAYKAAGVDIEAANLFVGRIKALVASTHTKGVVSGIGGFGGLYKPDLSQIASPVLVASTDGVGTKLKLAFALDGHDTVGIDLVAMNVNDVLVQGAKPLFFIDYFATGALDLGIAERVVAGIVEGCKQAGCALLGGETAEMPGFYPPGEYDLAGFCVGLVDNERIVDGSRIAVGDAVIGLGSSGLHSNGYSLARKILEQSGLSPSLPLPGDGRSVREVFLAPTRIYVRAVRNLMRDLPIKGMAHITGGGFYDNIPRVLPEAVSVRIRHGSWESQPLFEWLMATGELAWPEMLQVFNCGVGFVLIVGKDAAEDCLNRLRGMDQPAWRIGEVVKRKGDAEQVEVLF